MLRLIFAGLALSLGLAAAAPVMAAPASPVEAYGRLPALDDVALSPSGARMAMIVDDGKERKLVVTAMPGGLLAQFPVGKVKIRDIVWAGEDHVLVTSTETHDLGIEFGFKHEIAQTLVVDLAHGKTFFVFENGKISNAVFGFEGSAKIDGRWYGFFGGYKINKDGVLMRASPDLFRVDLDTGEALKVGDGSDSNRDWLVGADGRIVANSEYQEDVGRWRLYAGGGRDKLLYENTDKLFGGALVSEGMTPGSLIYVITDEDGKAVYMQTNGSDGGKPLASDHAIADVLVDPVTKLAVGVEEMGDNPKAVYFDAAAQKRLDAVRKPFAGRRVSLMSISADLRRVVVLTTGPGDSGTFWMIDGAKASQLGFQYPDVTDTDVGAVRMVDYTAADGLALHGVLTLPPGREARNLPLVVLPHGGPEARDYPEFDWWAQAFAARGYAVFQPNFRGSDGYGAAFVRAGYGEWGRKMQTDISDGVAELARQGIVDPKRACIVGGSYGGYAALAGVTVQHGLYRCAVSWGGVANPQGMLRRTSEYGAANTSTRYWKLFMGARDAISDGRLNEISPLALAARADAPILLLHGKDDTVVPIGQSRDMAKALKAAGKPVEMVELPEDHWLSTSAARTAMLNAAVGFVLKNNPPD